MNNQSLKCFYIAPFGTKEDQMSGGTNPHFDNIYHTIKQGIKTFKNPSIRIERADEIYKSATIQGDFIGGLHEADVVIADLSAANGNVFYELGIRHALRKGITIPVWQENTEIPSDLQNIKAVIYKSGNMEGLCKELVDVIRKRIEEKKSDSPVCEYLHSCGEKMVEELKIENESLKKKLEQIKNEKKTDFDEHIEKRIAIRTKRYSDLSIYGEQMHIDPELDAALIYLEMKTKIKPGKYPRAFLNGVSSFQHKEYYEAIKYFNEEINLKGKQFDTPVATWLFRAVAYCRLIMPKEAVDDFNFVLKTKPVCQAYNGRGYIVLKTDIKDIENALSDFKSATEKNENYFLAHINILECYVLKNEPVNMIDHINKEIPEDIKKPQYLAVISFFRYIALILYKAKCGVEHESMTIEQSEKKFEDHLGKLTNEDIWPFIRFEEWLSNAPINESEKKAIYRNMVLLQGYRLKS